MIIIQHERVKSMNVIRGRVKGNNWAWLAFSWQCSELRVLLFELSLKCTSSLQFTWFAQRTILKLT